MKKDKIYTFKQKVKYFKKRVDDISLTPAQRDYADSWLQGAGVVSGKKIDFALNEDLHYSNLRDNAEKYRGTVSYVNYKPSAPFINLKSVDCFQGGMTDKYQAFVVPNIRKSLGMNVGKGGE